MCERNIIKVGLLGDSIRIGYAPFVKEYLGEGYDVYWPEVNGCYAKFTLRQILARKDEMQGIDIIHWNNGLWDVDGTLEDGLFTGEDEYIAIMKRIAGILLSRHRKVIFATTTPVNPLCAHISNRNIDKYNRIIVPELEKMGVIINDLNSVLARDVEQYISEDHLHPNTQGSMKLAEQVVECICQVADTL